jgi:membrane-anchored protein YejM (alkaline phosphatase superfamily)
MSQQFRAQDPKSILFITLDSCRFDTFESANIPHLKSIGNLYCAMAPGNFTYSSHAAMFVGFTPGVAAKAEPFINPKYAKFFKMDAGDFVGVGKPFMKLEGTNIIDGLNRLGYTTLGTAAVGWFDSSTATGRHLSKNFQKFFYCPDRPFSFLKQLDWLNDNLNAESKPVFCFMNIGETHVPYYYNGAPWSYEDNPCVPFSDTNNAQECRRRQKACLEYVDDHINCLLDAFKGSTIIVCSDHGDCWGEDGLWEHGIHHKKVLEVPLIFRLSSKS